METAVLPKKIKTTTKEIVKKGKETLKNVGETVKENPNTVLYIGLGVLVVVVGYKVYKGASNKVDEIFNGDPNIDNQVDGTGGNTNNAIISNQMAINFAQQLLDAMNVKEPFYGTDNDTIELVFDKLLNGDDYLKVYNAFGKKDYNGYNSPPEGFWSILDSYEKRDLNFWLKRELSNFFEPTLYNKVKQRIESTGVFVF